MDRTGTPQTVTIGCGPYDRMIALAQGAFDTPDYRFDVRTMPVGQIPRAAFETVELDLAEVSIGEILTQLDAGNDAYAGVPAFVSMAFRHDCIYVPAGSDIASPKDLDGKRIGVTMHYGTTVIWVRHLLEAQFGVDLGSITWVVGKLNVPSDKPAHVPPSTLNVEGAPVGSTLEAMLDAGELDALVVYDAPAGFHSGSVRRLISDTAASERDYYQRFGAIPLLHLMVYRCALGRQDAAFPGMVLNALTQSKDRALANLRQTACYTSSLPSLAQHIEAATSLLGKDFWPYGLERNRKALEIFFDACHRQGLTKRRFEIAEVFPDFV